MNKALVIIRLLIPFVSKIHEKFFLDCTLFLLTRALFTKN